MSTNPTPTPTPTTDTDTARPTTQDTPSFGTDSVRTGAAAAQDALAPMIDKARTFARERPYATAALVGTVALALLNTLRGKRP